MNVGDMVRNKFPRREVDRSMTVWDGDIGLFVGFKTYQNAVYPDDSYTCSEVMWLKSHRISSIQTDLLQVINKVVLCNRSNDE